MNNQIELDTGIYTHGPKAQALEELTFAVTQKISQLTGQTMHGDRVLGAHRNMRISRMAYYLDHKDKRADIEHEITKFFGDKVWVVGVACIFKPKNVMFDMIAPSRHHHVLQKIRHAGHDTMHAEVDQGFLVYEKGNLRYMEREESLEIASHNGQLRRLIGAQYYQGHELYSEDLW